MPKGSTDFKPRCAAAVITALAVFVVVCPCDVRRWKLEHAAIAFVALMGLVLFADDTKTAVVATMALAALALHWKSSASESAKGESFTIGAPHNMMSDADGGASGHDPDLFASADAHVSYGAGSEHSLPDPGFDVEDLKALAPPDLLLAAQTNEIPSSGPDQPARSTRQ